jgi:hypothetical protein
LDGDISTTTARRRRVMNEDLYGVERREEQDQSKRRRGVADERIILITGSRDCKAKLLCYSKLTLKTFWRGPEKRVGNIDWRGVSESIVIKGPGLAVLETSRGASFDEFTRCKIH